MNNSKIVKMEKKHIKQVLEIENSRFNDPWNENLIKEEFEASNSKIYVYEDLGKVLAYVFFKVIEGDAELLKIAVHLNFEGCKIASELLKFAIDSLIKIKITKIFLEVKKNNLKAISFYEKFNFKKISERKNYYNDGCDAEIYRLDI